MFRFESIEYLHLLWLLPILILIYLLAIRQKKKAYIKFASTLLLNKLSPKRITKLDHIKFILFVVSFLLFSIALSNPQWGTKREKVKTTGSDIFIAIDISNSMLAQDISPSRLEKAKHFGEKLIKSLVGNRIGVIIFAGAAYLHVPLSNDYASLTMMLKTAHPKLAGTQGTAIDDVIDLVEKSITDDKAHQKALIIISDGETHDPKVVERSKRARENGLNIFSVGVGSISGGYIPVIGSNNQLTYKKDINGDPIVSKLNPDLLGSIVRDGDFYMLDDDEETVIESINSKISKMEKRELEQRSFTEYNSYFQYFLFSGLIFFVLSVLLKKKIQD